MTTAHGGVWTQIGGRGLQSHPKAGRLECFLERQEILLLLSKDFRKGGKKIKLSFSLKNCVLFRVWEKGTCSEAGVGVFFIIIIFYSPESTGSWIALINKIIAREQVTVCLQVPMQLEGGNQ